MSNSYRIRTTPGINKNISVAIDQDFEYLEILSLKIVQEQLYIRSCSDYGVVIGRISVNNGFGLPNIKVSIFIPLSDEDETNPIISNIYPYKTVSDVNEDGYRYNLLPYTQSHSNHVPTGTFFTKEDVLVDSVLGEVYDKYYKFTTTTNDSGDFMIFGVPTGQQTLFVDCDLSDIGEFSLTPNDLIRMGIATEDMVDKNKFKASNNLKSLPQIISFSRNIEVAPLWGEPEMCNLGITRTDFDLSDEVNLEIKPNAIFMGSLISTIDDTLLDYQCYPDKRLGELCTLSTGPGEIKTIRQTIEFDTKGRPLLEVFNLPNAGQVIDTDGVWMVDIPMNLDYVITNEFGEQVISSDPTQGIPTKGKYRFKIKWNQPPDLRDPIKRGYYLVPNIREYGWDSSGMFISPADKQKSYSFSINWDDYGDDTTPLGKSMIEDAINCEDKFYEFKYNKVYTVSNLITGFRKGFSRRRFIAIKNILDEQCESENNKFPANDAQKRTDIIFLLFSILITLMAPVLYSIMILMHIISFIVVVVLQPFLALMAIQFGISAGVETAGVFAAFVFPGAPGLAAIHAAKAVAYTAIVVGIGFLIVKIQKIKKYFQNFKIPNFTYPECELCDCSPPTSTNTDYVANQEASKGGKTNRIPTNPNGTSLLTQFTSNALYNVNNDSSLFSLVFSGAEIPPKGEIGDGVGTSCLCTYFNQENNTGPQLPSYTEIIQKSDSDDIESNAFRFMSTDLPLPERINLFNVKAKYFNNTTPNSSFNGGIGPANGGRGINQMKVRFGKDLNQPNTPLTNLSLGTSCHLDNALVVVMNDEVAKELTAGRIVCFQDTKKTYDLNYTGFSENDFGTKSITGTSTLSSTQLSQVAVTWADPNGGGNNTTNYYISGSSLNGVLVQGFPFDIEYFQVITAMTYTQFRSANVYQLDNSFLRRSLESNFYNVKIGRYYDRCNVAVPTGGEYYTPWTNNQNPGTNLGFEKLNNQMVVILSRGVDPHSPRLKCEFDLSKYFGYNTFGNVIVEGNYKLNIPIQGGPKNIKHGDFNNNGIDPYSGQKLFHKSFQFKPNNSDFKSFKTELTQLYSAVDNDNWWNNSNVGMAQDSTLGAKVGNNVQNNYLVRWDQRLNVNNGCGPTPIRGNYSSGANKGYNYYVGENVEGGAFLSMYNINIDASTRILGTFCVPCRYFGERAMAKTYYYSPKIKEKITFTDSEHIVMRGDRLPFSTFEYQPNPANPNFRPLHANPGFEVLLLDDSGFNSGVSTSSGIGDKDVELTGIQSSLECKSLAPFGCYDRDANGSVIVLDQTNSCWQNGINGENIMSKGCYIIVTVPLLSIIKDITLLTEWRVRMTTNFAACRNVFAHVFKNNWINGTLFAYAFQNEVTFDGQNNPKSDYCGNVIHLDQLTNNFYYRSTPYYSDGINPGKFVGDSKPSKSGDGSPDRILMFPTTIMDLGPRDLFIQEISVTDDYDGYIVNKLQSTTYSDVSALLNLFIINKLLGNSFFTNLITAGVDRYFNDREPSMIDGDYAQMVSINSEYSVTPFNPNSYQDPNLVYQSSGDDNVFGIFFKSILENRDFISPKRNILTGKQPLSTIKCAFDYIPVKTQTVPFYLWEIKQNGEIQYDSIFGSQKNDWFTKLTENGKFFDHKYQLLDRVDTGSKYFTTNNQSRTELFKGYIYSVGTNLDNDGNPIPSANNNTWKQSMPNLRTVNTGAPFMFYFGLKKGNSAFDKFGRVWLDFENIE